MILEIAHNEDENIYFIRTDEVEIQLTIDQYMKFKELMDKDSNFNLLTEERFIASELVRSYSI